FPASSAFFERCVLRALGDHAFALPARPPKSTAALTVPAPFSSFARSNAAPSLAFVSGLTSCFSMHSSLYAADRMRLHRPVPFRTPSAARLLRVRGIVQMLRIVDAGSNG